MKMARCAWSIAAILLTAWMILASQARAQDTRRYALIIANMAYSEKVGRLYNPHKDADLIRRALMAVGFPETNIETVRDASRGEILAAIERHARRLTDAGGEALGFLYYSGHGAAKPNTNRNFIIPVDVTDASSNSLWYDSIALESVRDLLQDYAPQAAHIVVFDACRNELQAGQRGGKGFVPVLDWGGMLIAYSTAPGQSASDGDRNAIAGPYASVLAEELQAARDLSVSELFADVRVKLRMRTNSQSPWFLHGLDRQVRFSAIGDTPPSTPASPLPPLSEAAQSWRIVQDSEDIATLEAFRRQYGGANPLYDRLAMARIEALAGRGTSAVPFQPPMPDRTGLIYEDKAQRLIRTFGEHASGVNSLAFSPDGKTFLSGGDDDVVKLWDVRTGQELRRFKAHSERVESVAFLPDGKRAVIGGGKTINVLDVGTARELRSIQLPESLRALALSPDGKTIVSGLWDKTVRLWDVASGRELKSFKFDTSWIEAVAFSPDGQLIATSDTDRLGIWDVASGQQKANFSGKNKAIAFSPNGELLLSGTDPLALYGVKSRNQVRSVGVHSDVSCVAFSPNGKTILSGHGSYGFSLWEAESLRELHRFQGHKHGVDAVAFSPDGTMALSGGECDANDEKTGACTKGFIKLWDISEWTRQYTAHP